MLYQKLMVETKEKIKGIKEEDKKDEENFKIDLEEMAQAGLHIGHRASRINPKMKSYLFGIRNTIHIIDLEKTREKLIDALKFIQRLVAEEKIILLVGTKIQIKDLVKKTAEECGWPYVSERWLGGTFTNFETISKRIEYYKDLERKKMEGEWNKYTKKERAKLAEELKKLEIKFEGIKNLQRLPDAIFVCDMKKDDLAVKEARMKGVKIISICDTNTDPTLVDYPIPSNDDAIASVKYILGKVKEAVKMVEKTKEGKKESEEEKGKKV